MKVVVIGATGETGSSIIDGLLGSAEPGFEIIAFARPTSVTKVEWVALRDRGVKVVPIDLNGPKDKLVKELSDVDAVVSAITFGAFQDQIPLIHAAKAAGVKRFVPCDFATVCPPGGVMKLREKKEEIHSLIKSLRLPYTFIDVGWWYQLAIPSLPSGRTDSAMATPTMLVGDGTVKSALTDRRDIGLYVARIIADPRTLNKMVFAYSEVLSQNEWIDILEKLSGEKVARQFMPVEKIEARLEELRHASPADPTSVGRERAVLEYVYSYAVRGDNTPEMAAYLGYLDVKELYPDLKPHHTLESFFQEALDGKVEPPYAGLRAAMAAQVASK